MRRVPLTASEKEMLWVALDRHRDAVVWKLPGLVDDDPEADMRAEADESAADILAFYEPARAASDKVIDELDLGDTGRHRSRRRAVAAVGADPHGRGDVPPRRSRRHRPRADRRHGRRPPRGGERRGVVTRRCRGQEGCAARPGSRPACWAR